MSTPDPTGAGRSHYKNLYERDLLDEARWLEFGALGKCDSIEVLLKKAAIAPTTVLEIGCGSGAILRELRRRGIGARYTGVDYSETAIDYAKNCCREIDFRKADITDGFFAPPGTHYDLIVLSHVLEHLEDPRPILRAVRALSFCVFIAEVPLEDLPAARLKSFVRDRRNNLAGHVQFFNARSFRDLIASTGFHIAGDRRYPNVLSRESVRLANRRNRFSPVRGFVYMMTCHDLPRLVPLWSRLYYAHYAVLCT